MKRGINDMRLQTMNSYNDLLYDLQMLIDNLNNTIKFIETGASKADIETCLHCDGDALNHIRVCLHNGGYDHD